MKASEEQPLIADATNIQKPKTGVRKDKQLIRWNHFILMPFYLFYFIGTSMFKYVHEDWVQNTIKTHYLGNETIRSNFSACEDNNSSDPDYQNYKHVQQMTSHWLIYYKLALYIPAFFASLVLPSYTDIYGRRFFLLVNTLAVCVRMCVETFIIFSEQKLFYILVLCLVEGLTGSNYSFNSVCFAYIADITNNNQRTFGVMSIEFLNMIAVVLSGFLSGLFIQTLDLGFKYSAIICSGMLVTAFLLAYCLPETNKVNQQEGTQTPMSALRQTIGTYYSPEFKGLRQSYLVLLLAFFFTELSNNNRLSLENVYFLGRPFCWGPSKIGYFSMTRHGVQAFVGFFSLKPMQKYMSDIAIALVSLISNMSSYILEAFARTSIAIYCVPVIALFSVMTLPVIRAMMSILTSSTRQGSVFASLAALEIIVSLTSTLENEVYAVTVSFMNGFVFLLMGLCALIAMVLVILYSCIKPVIYTVDKPTNKYLQETNQV